MFGFVIGRINTLGHFYLGILKDCGEAALLGLLRSVPQPWRSANSVAFSSHRQLQRGGEVFHKTVWVFSGRGQQRDSTRGTTLCAPSSSCHPYQIKLTDSTAKHMVVDVVCHYELREKLQYLHKIAMRTTTSGWGPYVFTLFKIIDINNHPRRTLFAIDRLYTSRCLNDSRRDLFFCFLHMEPKLANASISKHREKTRYAQAPD